MDYPETFTIKNFFRKQFQFFKWGIANPKCLNKQKLQKYTALFVKVKE